MKSSYRQFEHTGDLGIEASAPDEGSLFACCAGALFEILAGEGSIRPADSLRVEIEAPDHELLMVRWLRELLFLQDARGWLFTSFDVVISEGREGQLRLSATATGERFDPHRHRLLTGVKAVTYHEIEVTQRPDLTWRARVLFDI